MKPTKIKGSIGIWMDHAVAHLIEFTTPPMQTKTLVSKFTHDQKVNSMVKSENLMHNKEQHQQADFFKNIAQVIRNYDSVVLFGPTDAKTELFNVLKADNRFDKIKMEIKSADKMTENQQHAFVRDYFSGSLE